MTTLVEIPPSMIKWRASDPVEVHERPPKPERVVVDVPTNLAVIQSALDAIPNSGNTELDYDAWRNVVFAVHSATEGSDEGLVLVHEFSSRSSKYDPEFLDTRVWPYVRDERENAITVRSLYATASAHGWADFSVADDFEVSATGSNDPYTPTAEGSANAGATRFRAMTVAEFTAGKAPPWIIKGVLPKAALAVIFGESTAGKTFFALDLIAAVAIGGMWRDTYRVTQGRGVYICAEGVTGFRNRVRAFMRESALDDLDMRVIADAPNFMQVDDIKAIIAEVQRCGPVSVIVVDTFAQVMPGANENAGEDVGKAIYHCQQIHRVTGALVILIHHSGKDASKGARGHSSLKAASDAEIEVTRCDDERVATITKLKDGVDGTDFGFKLHTVVIGVDDDGDDITSCVIEHTAARPKAQRAKTKPLNPDQALVLAQFDVLESLGDALVSYTELIDAFKAERGHDPETGSRDQRKRDFDRALQVLRDRGTLQDFAGKLKRVSHE